MVLAILGNKKNQTRRTKYLTEINKNPDNWTFNRFLKDMNYHDIGVIFTNDNEELVIPFPYGNIGDILWVRETFTEWPKNSFQYFASTAFGDELGKWKPSIHMPKTAARIFLEITNIRIERLQTISEKDSINEGASDRLKHKDLQLLSGLKDWDFPRPFAPHQFGFAVLWCNINGIESWLNNPWVWVIEFKKIDKPLDFINDENK